jgi:hypothetical protein
LSDLEPGWEIQLAQKVRERDEQRAKPFRVYPEWPLGQFVAQELLTIDEVEIFLNENGNLKTDMIASLGRFKKAVNAKPAKVEEADTAKK